MNGENHNNNNRRNKEEWLRLCELAVVEKDPEKLLSLCQSISRLLEEKESAMKTTMKENAQ